MEEVSTLNVDEEQQVKLLLHYMRKHFDKETIERLVEGFSLSELRKLVGEYDIEFFARCYFPKYFDREFGEFHRELFIELKYLLNNKGLIECFGLPREHGKSTINSFLFPLYSALYDKSQFTLIISATEMIAVPFLDMIKSELEDNAYILEDFKIEKGQRWNNNEIWLKSSSGIDSCIMIRGIDGSLRGVHYKNYRPTLVLIDDLLKDDTVRSETKREQIKSTFTDVVLPIGTRDTNILVVGTVMHEEDIMSDLLRGRIPGVRSIRKSAITSWSEREDLWGEWEKVYNDLSDEDRINTAKTFFELNKEQLLLGTGILWNEYLDYYYLMCKKQAMGDRSFYKEMQNDPRSTDEYIFQELGYWERLPEFEEMEIVMAIDPAIKANKKSDFSAITVLGKHRKTTQMYVLDGSIHKVLPDDLFQIAIEKLRKYPVDRIIFESVQAQDYIKTKFEEELWKQQILLPVEGVVPKGNKHERIMSLEPDVKNQHILFCYDNISYNKMIKDYNKNTKNDDAPDSLYMAVQGVVGMKKIRFYKKLIH